MSDSSPSFRILVINPGSTSTKVSCFENKTLLFERSVFHEASELLQFPHVNLQMDFRYDIIVKMCEEERIELESIDAFVGRGGSACTQPGGITVIDQKLYDDTEAAVGGSEHPAKLGVMLAWRFACKYNKPAYTLNPTNVDEFSDLARLTGIKGVYRVSHSHVLNQKAVAEYHCENNGMNYEESNLIVAHIDGGITVAAHKCGRMIDGNMGADGDGAFSPTRIGSVPVPQLLDYMDSHSEEEVRNMCSRAGGFVSLMGTSNADIVHDLVDKGDPKATLVWNTMIYQVCKMIGEMSAVLCGKVDGILLTGGLMRFDDVLEGIQARCGWIAPISVYPGEMEQEALAFPALKVLQGRITPLKYTGRDVWQGFEDIGL
ncbi:MAG: butyrate kinase [Clostridiales bacterium]|nr:butyrate kinase [Clostridiales bacterium]